MIQEIGEGRFDNQYKNLNPKEGDRVFVFAGNGKPKDQILFAYDEATNTICVPTIGQIQELLFEQAKFQYLFSMDGTPFFLLWSFSEDIIAPLEEAISCSPSKQKAVSLAFHPLAVLRRAEPMDLCFAAVTAYHLWDWYRGSQFCGRCGTANVHDTKERMMRCPSCGQMHFPKICPAVIIAVRNGDTIMMSRYAGREYKGRALLAGFCEIGETPEETVVREVKEEIGCDVTNVTYFGSQPWGFDSDMLLGYYCDLRGDETVTIDAEELATAQWVYRDEIEPDTNLRSLTATMIEAFRTGKI